MSEDPEVVLLAADQEPYGEHYVLIQLDEVPHGNPVAEMMDGRIRGRQLPPEGEPGEPDLVVGRWKQKVAAEGVPVTIFVREPSHRI
jgi:hypothetical protein